MPMHAGLKAVLHEHEKPTHAGKRQALDALTPIVRFAAREQQQILEYRLKLTEAALDPDHDPGLESMLEQVHQTLGALERESKAVSEHARAMVSLREQLDRYFAEWPQQHAVYEASKAAKAAEPSA